MIKYAIQLYLAQSVTELRKIEVSYSEWMGGDGKQGNKWEWEMVRDTLSLERLLWQIQKMKCEQVMVEIGETRMSVYMNDD